MIENKKEKIALITGSAGFIGFHVSLKLLKEGWRVIGVDCMSDYYDVSLKNRRESILLQYPSYSSIHKKIETPEMLMCVFQENRPDIVVHLAAQAGVRYSIENPRSYLESNLAGTFELLEAARNFPPQHLLLASTSSAYGDNKSLPYREIDKADHQMSFYAATKKATENIAHSYSHLFEIPITIFRFFTVYGPWGRPDMALFKFTKAMLEGNEIDVYNFGKMKRDFTYIDDLVNGIHGLIPCVPSMPSATHDSIEPFDSLSKIAPHRVVNIGNSESVELLHFIEEIEDYLGIVAQKNFMPMQSGDIPETLADTTLLTSLTGYRPHTPVKTGVRAFVDWYREYYNV
jgi:UDP-glucuronate 4-epimerase